ncbi:MAG: hypothetical protein CL820_03700 [Croceicoccus sp.]|nr:hypothetical protein [Croceicoccus sp.]MAL24991.1 hypothetical protein [Croceicoccus sp.]|tara:strand:+ start:9858 stop:10310 length:453 start_codon:yes stop_codon:yes gene_type:complete
MSEMPENVRTALERHLIEYCYAVDGLEDVGPLMDLFTDDAVADFSAIGLPAMTGREEIGAFYKAVFADMTHHFHFISNFRPDGWDADEGAGAMTAYVIGMGAAKDGSSITVQVKYRMECVQQGGAWKCRHYAITPMMPMPGSLAEVHGQR